MVSTKGRLLLVDDDRHLLESMASWLRDLQYEVDTAAGLHAAIPLVDGRKYDLVLADIRLGDGDGFDLLAHCRQKGADPPVILMSGYATVDTGVEAIRQGAFDLLTKPLIDDELELAIDRALSQQKVLEENQHLKAQLDQRYGIDSVIGSDHRMQKIYDIIHSVADTRATVLITGESGTGKSLIARALHRLSDRRDKSFVEVACGALPENLLESELFGHVAGAFTGAVSDKTGKFLQADRGTIFLDEIGTASPGMQVKLLRVLQEFEFEPVGGSQTHRVNSRVVLATNENLTRAVAEGRFRQDLYYRIHVITVEVPPLRERLSDIPTLATHFLKRICDDTGKKVEGFSDSALAAMQRHNWPGNVRELQNVVERAVLLGKNSEVGVDDLPTEWGALEHVGASSIGSRTLKEALEGPERQIIRDALERYEWNRNVTADILGINRTTLYKKMKRLGLEK
ncbi:sigma-54-dependent transcriptional regulator [Lignipirellula cremea]|uniref:Transcriptional regulatory protein ZraR n=1 Tax=Lignipirellula cremea TaxID=2528010 RepID=A0A518DUI5_9BACT|nr:sigma-54 dependent transcriptional regulator [Lignipirellula cremea]QDU95489.1 Transcriptional regulatory protein ZraR [Lignipirellula cremea]